MTGQSSGYTKGAYGGVSQEVGGGTGTTVHGGTYGAKHTGEHKDRKPFWPYLTIVPLFTVVGYFI
ncbi:18048_t:CDS:2, partial [Racocetra persica]